MNKCIIWKKAISSTGYGATFYKGKNISAHRLTWIKNNGEIPKGLLVLHKCDIRSCVNIEHLWLGSHKENSQNMVKKGRAKGGRPTIVKNGKKPCKQCGLNKSLIFFTKSRISHYGIPIYNPK